MNRIIFQTLFTYFVICFSESDDGSGTLNPFEKIFIFVNPSSGGNRASELLSLSQKIYHHTGIISLIYDIREGESGNKTGFKQLFAETTKGNRFDPMRVIVAGGDGTVMWTMQESIKHKIDMSKIAFGVLPYGTGNDFSRTLNWGSSAPNDLKKIISFVKLWQKAKVENFDLWNIRIKVSENGGLIQKIENKKKISLPSRILVKPMINYFSMGVESRVGYGFDKHRTKSQNLNKAVYFSEGLKKIYTQTLKISDIVSSVSSFDRGLIFSTDTCGVRSLCNNPASLIFLNIPSFSAGCDIWKRAKKSGLDRREDVPICHQNPGDGKLEILTFKSLIKLSMEQIPLMTGNGHRIEQVEGPIRIDFKEKLFRTYMQIDGEYFAIDNPQYARISHKLTVQVLVNNY